MMNVSRSYSLSLSDGSSWRLTSDEDNALWLDKFASIMQLQECALNDCRKIKFCNMGSVDNVEYHLLCHDSRTIHIWQDRHTGDAVCQLKYNDNEDIAILNMWNSLKLIYDQSIKKGGLILHAALIEHDGKGFLLAAPGNTGKSTCCRRLPDRWKPLCDDATLVVLDKNGNYAGHPFPTWSDHIWKRAKNTWNVQYSVPVAGIFFLEQSEMDKALPLGNGESAMLIGESSEQIYRGLWRDMRWEDRRKIRLRIFSNACQTAKMIPAFQLQVSLCGRFWEEIEKVVK
jgi:SynChlorMet cassette protein ScmC